MPQRRDIRPGRARWTLSGADVRPRGREWTRATPEARAAYWPILARWAKLGMTAQLLAGEGTDGAYMRQPKAISRKWYRDRGREWRGKTMSPQHADSRFIAQLVVMAGADRVVGTWPRETARIASYHARGKAGRGRPIFDGGRIVGWRGLKGQTTGIVRDFVGLNPKWLAWAVRKAVGEWRTAVGVLATPAPKPPKARPPRPPRANPPAPPKPPPPPRPVDPLDAIRRKRAEDRTPAEWLALYPRLAEVGFREAAVQLPATPPAVPPTSRAPGLGGRFWRGVRGLAARIFGGR